MTSRAYAHPPGLLATEKLFEKKKKEKLNLLFIVSSDIHLHFFGMGCALLAFSASPAATSARALLKSWMSLFASKRALNKTA